MPSHHEGFGLPALEAMAAGTPVVVSDRGALPEVVGEAGILVDPNDVVGIAEVVAGTLGDRKLLSRMSRLGRQRAREFSWRRTARETLAVYQEVLAEAGPGMTWQTGSPAQVVRSR
jgi:glycosyltransferase involved in cell wall biosynthesis